MLVFSILLGCLGLTLSSMFSGAETAFYRLPKVRVKLDAISGDRKATRLLWLVNRPSLFVATILVGNNVANYAVSMATVLCLGALLPNSRGILVEIASTLCLAPLLFVYGEMFPKYLCLHAPNRMIRLLSPAMMFFVRLFLPVTLLVWLLNRVLAKLLGESREILELTLGRQELIRILEEGRETGLLFDTQRRLADGVFRVSSRTLRNWATPHADWPMVTTDMKPDDVLRIARKWNLAEMPVYERVPYGDDGTEAGVHLPIGYVRVIDLEIAIRNHLDEQSRQLLQLLRTELPIRSMVEISSRHTVLTAMILMQTLHSSFGSVVDEHHHCIGFVRSDQLRDILLDGEDLTETIGNTTIGK